MPAALLLLRPPPTFVVSLLAEWLRHFGGPLQPRCGMEPRDGSEGAIRVARLIGPSCCPRGARARGARQRRPRRRGGAQDTAAA
eukprot:2124465-Pyramimonas_sp.AAC.1